VVRRSGIRSRGGAGRVRAAAAAVAAWTVIALAPVLILSQAAYAGGDDEQKRLAEDAGAGFSGEAALGGGPSLEDYLAYAAHSSPRLRAAYYDWTSRLERVPVVSSLPEPVFSYMYFVESVETRVGPQRQKFSLSQAFPWFGTLGARESVAEQEAWAAYRRFQAEKLRLAYRVRKAYSEYYLIGRRIAIERSTLELLISWESISRVRFETGQTGRSDLVRIEIEMARVADALRALEDSKSSAAEEMRNVLGAPEDTEVPFPDAMPRPAVIEPDTVMSAVLSGNPSILAIDHMILRDENALRLAGKSSYPDFALGLEYIDTGPALDPAMPESGKDPWMVSLSLKLPVWFGRNSALKDEAMARLEMNRYERIDTESDLRARMANLLVEYRDASAKTELYAGQLIPKAEESLAVTLTEYEGGEADFLHVLDAQRLLLDLRLEMEEAQVKREISAAELEMLAGRSFRPAD
jgi:cobalt-zinc-cadmium efflux system outer membrane protein